MKHKSASPEKEETVYPSSKVLHETILREKHKWLCYMGVFKAANITLIKECFITGDENKLKIRLTI